jgi:antitoxin StbD
MNTVSISKLKVNPMSVLSNTTDYPVQLQNRNKTVAYVVGKDLFEKMVSYMEEIEDKNAVKNADCRNSTALEDLESELGFS